MSVCPFAQWDPISGDLGQFIAEPFKIVHHTTEGSTYAAARAAYEINQSDPHFTVDGDVVYQHIDTTKVARALRHAPGGTETNRSSAIQIELVAFAGQPKPLNGLATAARLCRWIEQAHSVPQLWPSGHPKPPLNGQDPGGHNRDATNWRTIGGHYGHSQVPDNTHWDPAYTAAEIVIVTPNG